MDGQKPSWHSLARVWGLLAAAWLFYPVLAWTSLTPFPGLEGVKLFTPGALAALALGLSFWALAAGEARPSARVPLLVFALFAALAAVHFPYADKFDPELLIHSLFWVAVAMAAYLHADAARAALPPFLASLWLVNAILCLRQLAEGTEMSGLALNRNWTASLVVATAPAAAWLAGLAAARIPRAPLLFSRLTVGVVAAMSLAMLLGANSRGATLAAGLVGVAALVSLNWDWIVEHRRPLVWGMLALATAAAAGFAAAGVDLLARALASDVRPHLWEGCLRMILDHPWIGVGLAGFETNFAAYRPPGYFFGPHATVRTEHPHNHLLLVAAAYGLPAAIAWGYALASPFIRFFQSRRRLAAAEQILGFACLALLVHAMFDMGLYQWPGNVVFAATLGLLWRRRWPPVEPGHGGAAADSAPGPSGDPARPRIPRLAAAALGVAMLALAAKFCHDNLYSSIYYRQAMRRRAAGDTAAAFDLLDRSIAAKPTAQAVYRAAVESLTRRGDPAATLRYFSIMKQRIPHENYAHSRGFQGLAALELGEYRAAAAHFEAENRNFPTLSVPLYHLAHAYHLLGDKQMEAEALRRLDASLEMKGLDQSHLELLFAKPEFDMKPAGIRNFAEVRDKNTEE